MPESKNFLFDYVEMATMMIRKLDLHEGLWGVYFEFSPTGANIPISPDQKTFAPASIVIIKSVGIQRFDAPSNLTVDAALVNPKKDGKPPTKK
jgi:hypothetical protein